MTPAVRRLLPSAMVAASAALALVYIMPKTPRQPFTEAAVWASVVLVSFAGWGWLVKRLVAKDERVDLGLLIGWGASAMACVGGLLMVPSLMNRDAMMILVDLGILAAFAGLWFEAKHVRHRLRFWGWLLTHEPKVSLLVALVAFVVVLHSAIGIAEWHNNPYDDDIAYLAFVRRLYETGSLIEPFSFRRLAAMGGQTFFVAIAGVRTGFKQAHTFDRAICVVIVALLVAGFRLRGRRSVLFASLTVLAFVLMPIAAINTAAYYSGVAFFLTLFRTLVWLGERERAPWKSAVPLAMAGAITCTLRQNFLPIPAAMLATSYLCRFVALRSRPWKARLAEPLFAAGFSVLALLPWMIVAWQSSRTFLYPIVPGTFNRALELKSTGMTFVRELYMQVWVAVEGFPFRTLGLFLLAAMFVAERSSRKPLWSTIAGAGVGFVMLVHGLSQSDAGNIGRYAYGFVVATVLAVALTAGAARWRETTRSQIAAATAFVALLLTVVEPRAKLYEGFYQRGFANMELLRAQAPRSNATEPPEVRIYADMQATVPPGERIAVLLDEPYLLSFSRNPIYNLDMPGYASLPPGLPFFTDTETVEKYFRGLGVRYLAFVKSDFSRYHYRREYWLSMVSNEQEIWRAFTPYLLFFMETCADMAKRHRPLFDYRGIVMLDLEAPPP